MKRPRVLKTIVQVTILHRDDYSPDGRSLDQIAEDIGEGSEIGMMQCISTEPVDPHKVVDELKIIGNDGTFFDDEF